MPRTYNTPQNLTSSTAPTAQPGTSRRPGGPSESPGPARPTTYTVQPTECDNDATATIKDLRGNILTAWDLVPKTMGRKGSTAKIESKFTVTLEHAKITDKEGGSHGPTVKGWAILEASTGTAWVRRY